MMLLLAPMMSSVGPNSGKKNLKIPDKRYENLRHFETFMPNLMLVSPSEIFYQLSAPLIVLSVLL
jgi:hypothetical protein